MHWYLYRALLLVFLSIIIVNSTHRPIRRQSGLVPLTLLLKPRLPPPTPAVVDTPPPLMWECHLLLPSLPTLCPAGNSRCPRVPVQVLQLLASATDQWQRWSLLSSESAPNSATRAMPRTALRAPHSSSTGGSWCLVISQQALSGDEQFNICSDNGHCI